MPGIFDDPEIYSDPAVGAVPPSDIAVAPSSGIGLSNPDNYEPLMANGMQAQSGLGLSPAADASPAKASQLDLRRAAIGNMSGTEKFLSALSEFGAGLQGRPSPLDAKIKQQREERSLQTQELSANIKLMHESVGEALKLDGDQRTQYIDAMAPKLDQLQPGMGTALKTFTANPGMIDKSDAIISKLPRHMQDLYRLDKPAFIKASGTAEGQKQWADAYEGIALDAAAPKAMASVIGFQHLVSPELSDRIQKQGYMTTADFNDVQAALPDSSPAKMIPDELRAAMKSESFLTAHHILTPAALKLQKDLGKGQEIGSGGLLQPDGTIIPPASRPDVDTGFMKEAAALYGKDTPEYNAAVAKHVARMNAPTSVMVNGGDQGGLTPDAIKVLAKEAAKDKGVLANIGRGNQGAKDLRAVLNQMAEDTKGDGPGIAATRATFRADSTSLNKLTQNYDAITAFEDNAVQQGRILKGLVDKVDATGVPVAERWIRAGRKSISGDADVSDFNAQLQIYRTEAAKILTNPNLSGMLTDSARHEVENFLGNDATGPQIKRVVNRLENDFGLRKKSLETQMDTIRGRLTGQNRRASDQAPAPAAGPFSDADKEKRYQAWKAQQTK